MKNMTKYSTAALVLVALWVMPTATAQDYPLHGRVSFDLGGTMVKGAEDADWSQAPVNTLIMPGDVLWVDQGGTAELELAGGVFLRMADGSKAEMVSLPPSTDIKGWYGSFYVQRLNRSTGEFIFEAPACRLRLGQDAAVRLDILEAGSTTVSVRWGQATVLTEFGEQTLVNAGERCWIDPGLMPSNAMPFDMTSEDDFDVWNRERAKLLAAPVRTAPKTVSVRADIIGYDSLGSCGEWVVIDNRSYWQPTVVVDFVPYRNGQWSYVHGVGHVWVDDYPFGYVTSHYWPLAPLPAPRMGVVLRPGLEPGLGGHLPLWRLLRVGAGGLLLPPGDGDRIGLFHHWRRSFRDEHDQLCADHSALFGPPLRDGVQPGRGELRRASPFGSEYLEHQHRHAESCACAV